MAELQWSRALSSAEIYVSMPGNAAVAGASMEPRSAPAIRAASSASSPAHDFATFTAASAEADAFPASRAEEDAEAAMFSAT